MAHVGDFWLVGEIVAVFLTGMPANVARGRFMNPCKGSYQGGFTRTIGSKDSQALAFSKRKGQIRKQWRVGALASQVFDRQKCLICMHVCWLDILDFGIQLAVYVEIWFYRADAATRMNKTASATAGTCYLCMR